MAFMDFDSRTYSTLDDLRAGRWYLPVSEEVAGRHREVAGLLKEFNHLGNTDPARGEELPDGVPVEGLNV